MTDSYKDPHMYSYDGSPYHSPEQARIYAQMAGFTVTQDMATRPDMPGIQFKLGRDKWGWQWYRRSFTGRSAGI